MIFDHRQGAKTYIFIMVLTNAHPPPRGPPWGPQNGPEMAQDRKMHCFTIVFCYFWMPTWAPRADPGGPGIIDFPKEYQ